MPFFLIFSREATQKKEYPSIKKGDFPDGIYMTLEDVLQKTPGSAKYDSIHLPGKVFL